MTDVLLTDVEVEGRAGMDVLVRDGVLRDVAPSGSLADAVAPGVTRIAGGGAALLPGLHDHHLHLFALAARAQSLWCGPPAVTDAGSLAERLREVASQGAGWIRGVGWDDTVAGWPDRSVLDRAVADRPLRLQHRSGAMWVLNTEGLSRLGLGSVADAPPGVEIGEDGSPTGRIAGLDDWMRARIGGEWPSLRAVSSELAGRGVTGVTDATAHNGADELGALAEARRSGALEQRLFAMTAGPGVEAPPEVGAGPVKLVLFEPELPALEVVVDRIAAAHEAGRAVAIHAASRATVLLAVAALAEVGATERDRVEHASVVTPESLDALAGLGVTVVTQPHFIAESGDRYLATVEPRDQPWLYRARSFLEAGVPLAAGSDAPVGGHDPWAVMAAAVERRTASGEVMGPDETLAPEQALALFLGKPDHPGGAGRRLLPGGPADLCLIDRPWDTARRDLAGVRVSATIIGGRVVHLSR